LPTSSRPLASTATATTGPSHRTPASGAPSWPPGDRPQPRSPCPRTRRSRPIPQGPTPFRSLGRVRRAASPWARLLARIYEVLPLLCPVCQGEMRVIAFLTDPAVVRDLRHLGIQFHPHPRPRSPSGRDRVRPDSGPRSHPRDPGPELDFDQSLPEWES
jgi:hypothetical protein